MKIREVNKTWRAFSNYTGIYRMWCLFKGLEVDIENPIIKTYESNKIR